MGVRGGDERSAVERIRAVLSVFAVGLLGIAACEPMAPAVDGGSDSGLDGRAESGLDGSVGTSRDASMDSSDGVVDSGLDVPVHESRDVASDSNLRAECFWGNGPFAWRSFTRATEFSPDGQCPTVVGVRGYAGDLDCGRFEACCSFPSSCRFRVDVTFHDDRPQPCTGAVPCFPPLETTNFNCRCDNGVIRCEPMGNPAFPYSICSDCHLPQVCDAGRD